jgi:prevent-host-death family protein
MKQLQVAEDILSVSELKTHASEIVRQLGRHGRPLVVTQSGKPAAVILAPKEFDRLVNRARLVAAVDAGLADIEAGRVVSDRELSETLDAEFGKRGR